MEHLNLALFERLGGWAIVLLVVRWMMLRMDRLIDQMQTAVDSFRRFQIDAEQTHSKLIEVQEDILEKLRRTL